MRTDGRRNWSVLRTWARACLVMLACGAAWAKLAVEAPGPTAPAPPTVAARAAALEALLAEHDRRYFIDAAPTISDAEYDRLKAQFEELRRNYPELLSPVDAIEPLRPGVRLRLVHASPMLSLPKAHSTDDVQRFMRGVAQALRPEPVKYVIEPKIDGLAISATYEHGHLVRALTRGDGHRGEDVTVAVKPLAPPVLIGPSPERIELRGEIFVTTEDFAEINALRMASGEPAFASPRHLAAGTMQQNDPIMAIERRLALVFFAVGEVVPASARPASQQALLTALHAWGAPAVAPFGVAESEEDVARIIARAQAELSAYPLPTDGVVVKVDSGAQQARLGATSTAPRWAIARKFSPPRAETRLREVVWQVGRTGVLTPVAEFDPVDLDGNVVRRATLHNAEELARRGLHDGDTIVIERAGGVIPAIAAIRPDLRDLDAKPVLAPTNCPACGVVLAGEANAGTLRCDAPDCAAKLIRRLEHFAGPNGLRIEGLGTETLTALVESGRVRAPADLFRLAHAEADDGAAPAWMRAIEGARAPELERFLQALGLPGIGRTTARLLAAKYEDVRVLVASSAVDFEAAGLRPRAAATLAEYFAMPERRQEIEELLDAGVSPRTRRQRPPD